MCCNYKDHVVEALNLLRDQTGLRIGQKEWHQLRNAAEARMHAEGTLAADARLTNGKADTARVVAVVTAYAAALGTDEATRNDFIARMEHMGLSHGNAATLEEVTRKVTAGEPFGVVARQPKNGKNVTEVDMLARAGGYLTPEPYARGGSLPRRVIDPAVAALAAASTAPAPTTRGRAIAAHLSETLRAVQAHHGKVTNDGVVFEIGDRTDGGYAFSVKAVETRTANTVSVTVFAWRDARKANVEMHLERVPLSGVNDILTDYATKLPQQVAA